MQSIHRKAIILIALAAGVTAVTSSAYAGDTKFEKHHPRREQVNNRLERQHDRIAREVKEGEMTKGQARKLRTEDRQIRGEERAMASQNGGHITKTEQTVLNQQENAVSKQIGK